MMSLARLGFLIDFFFEVGKRPPHFALTAEHFAAVGKRVTTLPRMTGLSAAQRGGGGGAFRVRLKSSKGLRIV